jgi:hypothetical protein
LLILIQTVLLTTILGQDTATKGVLIPTIPARSIIKDLIVGDANKIELIKKDFILSKKDNIIKGKDSIIILKTSQIENYKSIINYKDTTIYLKDRIIISQDRKLKLSKAKTTISQVGLIVLFVFTILKLK